MAGIIGRWTTPTLLFRLPFDASGAEKLSIAFKQCRNPEAPSGLLFEKRLSDCTIDGNEISVVLSTQDTRLIDKDKLIPIYIQIRINIGGKEVVSKYIQADPYLVLKDGEIDS